MKKTIIQTKNAPAPNGPYSQAVLVGAILYTSGQIAINPISGELVQDTIELETEQVMQNIKGILNEVGMTFENVFKTTIFLSDMKNFAKVNAVYGSYFNEETAPARETVEVANLPKYVNVEISVMATK